MLQRIKNLLERNATLIAIIITITIAVLSLKTFHFKNPIKISFFDKILHSTAYFVVTLAWLFSQRLKKNKLIIVILLFLYGILLELFQGWFTPNRTKDYYDVIANGFGIIIAALLFKYLYKFYKRLLANLN
ncbi:MAG: VanZ family protein [Flavobacteriaceae bacterium]|nr:VanZ family protein [Flavobacteriaceae bacterium]